MGKKKKLELDEKASKRLAKLAEEWDKQDIGYGWLTSVSVADLRLLFEHFAPLRQIIRDIALDQGPAAQEAAPQSLEAEESLEARLAAARAEAQTLRAEAARLARAVEDAIRERDEARRQLVERDAERARLAKEAQAAQDETQRLHDKLRAAARENEALARELETVRCRPPLGKAGEVLAFLCRQEDLLKRLGLEGLSGDAESLVRMVAVLAQKDNVLRLLEALGEAAQTRRAPLAENERELLEAAVGWLNHNWKTKPYRIVWPEAGAPFNYDAHKRASYTPSGERLAKALAPGLQNSQGGWECKPIVVTE